MQLFLDTANVDQIREGVDWGVVHGATTNPTLMAREGRTDTREVLAEICDIVPGAVSAEVLSLDAAGMVSEARDLAGIAENIVIKIPMTAEGTRAVRELASEGIKTNVTLVFSANQGLLAALAGATYVSPFVGRLDDAGHDGMEVVRLLAEIFAVHDLPTGVIAASIRHPLHVVEAARAGADVITVPHKVLTQMFRHPLTDRGIEAFVADWKHLQEQG